MLRRYLDPEKPGCVYDIGARGDLRMREFVLGTNCSYVGCDIESGKNVDIVLSDPHRWSGQIGCEVADVVLARNVLEHVKWPWAWLESVDVILRPGGLFFCSAPKCWKDHREPLDCWRFLPDGLQALADWVGWSVLELSVRRVRKDRPHWKIVYAVFRKPEISS